MWNLISPREKSLSILKIITIRANAVASTFATGQAPNELCYRRVGAEAESLQPFLRNRGAMAATQALKSDTLHPQFRRFAPVDDNGAPRVLLPFEPQLVRGPAPPAEGHRYVGCVGRLGHCEAGANATP